MKKIIAGIGIMMIIIGLLGIGMGGFAFYKILQEIELGLLGGLEYILFYLLILLPIAITGSGSALVFISKISEEKP